MQQGVLAVRRRNGHATWIEVFRHQVQVACDRRDVSVEESVGQRLSAEQLRTFRKRGVLIAS